MYDKFLGKVYNVCKLHVPVCFILFVIYQTHRVSPLGDIDAHLTWFEQSLQEDDSQTHRWPS